VPVAWGPPVGVAWVVAALAVREDSAALVALRAAHSQMDWAVAAVALAAAEKRVVAAEVVEPKQEQPRRDTRLPQPGESA